MKEVIKNYTKILISFANGLKKFESDKYNLLHFGMSNQDRTFTVNSRALGIIVEQRDLGEQLYSSLKVAHRWTGWWRMLLALWPSSLRALSIEVRILCYCCTSCWCGYTGVSLQFLAPRYGNITIKAAKSAEKICKDFPRTQGTKLGGRGRAG